MAALSAFMADESSRKTYDYMEESITTYLNTCKYDYIFIISVYGYYYLVLFLLLECLNLQLEQLY